MIKIHLQEILFISLTFFLNFISFVVITLCIRSIKFFLENLQCFPYFVSGYILSFMLVIIFYRLKFLISIIVNLNNNPKSPLLFSHDEWISLISVLYIVLLVGSLVIWFAGIYNFDILNDKTNLNLFMLFNQFIKSK